MLQSNNTLNKALGPKGFDMAFLQWRFAFIVLIPKISDYWTPSDKLCWVHSRTYCQGGSYQKRQGETYFLEVGCWKGEQGSWSVLSAMFKWWLLDSPTRIKNLIFRLDVLYPIPMSSLCARVNLGLKRRIFIVPSFTIQASERDGEYSMISFLLS